MTGSAGAPIGPSGASLVIRRDVEERWRSLDHRLRARVAAVLSGSADPGLVSAVDGKLPDAFAHDLATGGCRLRSAFPALTRVVASIASCSDSIEVVVTCAGHQTGPFYGLIAPTLRLVQFELAHRFALDVDLEQLQHRIHIDVRRIVAQLGHGAAKGGCR